MKTFKSRHILFGILILCWFSAGAAAEEAALKPPSRGPENAKVTIVEHLDFYCPYCKHSLATTNELLKSYPKDVRLVFRHFPLGDTPGQGSYLAHEAAACAAEQERFWEFHDTILQTKKRFEKSDFLNMASQFNLDSKKFETCLDTHKYQKFIDSEVAYGVMQGVSGTPAFFINGHNLGGAYPVGHFKKIIDKILSGREEELKKPERITFNDLDGKPDQGPAGAPATIVEFSDFHCPYCKQVAPTLDQLMQKYPGAIHRVWRHFPLPMHDGALKTHEASECAAEQGKFWQYHNAIFQNQQRLRQEGILNQLAAETGLDQKAFDACLTSEKYRQRVENDILKGRDSGVQGTPAVFVNGRLISGARPFEYFDKIVREAIDEKD